MRMIDMRRIGDESVGLDSICGIRAVSGTSE